MITKSPKRSAVDNLLVNLPYLDIPIFLNLRDEVFLNEMFNASLNLIVKFFWCARLYGAKTNLHAGVENVHDVKLNPALFRAIQPLRLHPSASKAAAAALGLAETLNLDKLRQLNLRYY